MKLPSDSLIAREKLADYLLRPRDDHDKAGFLAVAGYTPAHVEALEADLRTRILPLEAEAAGSTAYGDKFLIRGPLPGPNGRTLNIISV